MKKKKLHLDQLEVNSFVTSTEKTSQETLKGGQIPTLNTCNIGCRSLIVPCFEETVLLCPTKFVQLCLTQMPTGCTCTMFNTCPSPGGCL